jgi:hypothetical protein
MNFSAAFRDSRDCVVKTDWSAVRGVHKTDPVVQDPHADNCDCGVWRHERGVGDNERRGVWGIVVDVPELRQIITGPDS